MRTLASPMGNRPHTNQPSLALPLVAMLLFAVFSGAVVALGSKFLLLPILAMMGLLFVLAVPVTWTLWLMFVALFVVLGPVIYFSHFTQLQWLPPLMGSLFIVHVLVLAIRGKPYESSRTAPAFVYLLVAFLLLVTVATVIDKPGLPEVVNSMRFYFFMWPVMLVFMLGIVKPGTIEQLWKALLLVVLLQVPFVIYQYFFVARKSTRMSPWDAVVGTFPGNIEGGGQSHAMGIMLLILMLATIALWRHQKLHGVWASLILVSGIGVLALAEVKAVVLLLPFAVALYYRREITRRPLESLLLFVGTGALVAALFVGYEHFHYSSTRPVTNPTQPNSTSERILKALSPEAGSPGLHQIGRVTHLVVWWDVNVGKGDVQHSLFGYGVGATQVSNLGAGEIARRFPYVVDVTSSTILLWETGLLGHFLFLGILLSGARLSGRLSANPAVPATHQILLRVGAVGLVILAITLPYKDYAITSTPIQFLIMLMLGQAGYWSRMVTKPELKEGGRP